jgi:hypothetical protein
LEKQKNIQCKRTQHKALQEALEATRAELLHHNKRKLEDDEEGWEGGQHDEESDWTMRYIAFWRTETESSNC